MPFQSSKKNALQPIIPPPLDVPSLSHITYADLETDQYNQYTYTDNQHYQQYPNDYQPVPYQQNSSTVDYVADRLRHLGEEAEDVEMTASGMINGGDYQYPYQYDQYQNGRGGHHDQYWNQSMEMAPEVASAQVAPDSTSEDPQTATDMEMEEDMMKYFFVPNQQVSFTFIITFINFFQIVFSEFVCLFLSVSCCPSSFFPVFFSNLSLTFAHCLAYFYGSILFGNFGKYPIFWEHCALGFLVHGWFLNIGKNWDKKKFQKI